MRRFQVAVPLLYLVLLAAACTVFADVAWKTVTGYQSGYALDRRFEAGPTLASHVLVVVVDGLRVDRAADLPVFSALAERGASGTLQVVLPSLSYPARAALLTGAPPEVSGVTNNGVYSTPPIQSLFGLAQEAGMGTSVYGARFWSRAFGDQLDSYRGLSSPPASYSQADLTKWQDRTCTEAIEHLAPSNARFKVADLFAGDEAGHAFGGNSDGYRTVTLSVDDCLGRLVESAGPETTVIAVSDHGHIDRWGKGGHGGQEPEVLFAPFAMAGPGVQAAPPINAQLVDITPTISALLGLPIPANSQGKMLWDILDVSADQVTILRELERTQRVALQHHMPDRELALTEQRRARVPSALVAFGWFAGVALLAVWRQRPSHFAMAMAVFVVVYHGLFYLFQLGNSLSTVVRQEYLNFFFARNVVAVAIAFVASAECLRRLATSDSAGILRLSALASSAFGLLITATHLQFGLLMEGWMIEIGPGFKAYLNLVAVPGLLLGTLLALGANALRRRRQETGA